MLATLIFFGVTFQATDPRSILLDRMRVRSYGVSFTMTNVRTGERPPFFPTVTITKGTLAKGTPRDDDTGGWTPVKADMERWSVTPTADGVMDFTVHYPAFSFSFTDLYGAVTVFQSSALDIPIHIENFRSSDVDKNGFANGLDYDTFVEWFEAGDRRADWDDNSFVNGDDFDLFCDFYARGA